MIFLINQRKQCTKRYFHIYLTVIGKLIYQANFVNYYYTMDEKFDMLPAREYFRIMSELYTAYRAIRKSDPYRYYTSIYIYSIYIYIHFVCNLLLNYCILITLMSLPEMQKCTMVRVLRRFQGVRSYR